MPRRVMEDAAHRLQDHNIFVVCLRPMSKLPLFTGWQDVQSTHALIHKWFRSCPQANLGIHTGFSQLAVADCDSQVAAEWVAANLPQSSMFQHTPHGGLHVFLRDPGNVPCKLNVMRIGLDIKAKRSCINVAPSVCADGAWRLEGLTRPELLPAMPTDWLRDAERAVQFSTEPSTLSPDFDRVLRYCDRAEAAISGQGGHGRTFGLACRLLRVFPWLAYEQLLLALRHFNARCEPPWSDRELIHKTTDALKKVRGP